MTETTSAAQSATSPACCQPPCGGAPCCPCAPRLQKLEKTVCRIRLWLFVSLGFLILLVGIAIGSGSARKEMREHMMMGARPAAAQPHPGAMQQPGPMAQPVPGPQHGPGPQPGPMMQGGPGPQHGPMMGGGPGPQPGVGARGGDRRAKRDRAPGDQGNRNPGR